MKEIICGYCSGAARIDGRDCPVCEARGHVRLASENRYVCSSCSGSSHGDDGAPCHLCHGIGWLDANRQPIKIYKWNVQAPIPTVFPGLAEAIQRALQTPSQPPQAHTQLIAPSRIEELKACAPTSLDFTKLIRLCEEANANYENKCYAAVAMLTRAILDHVPPVFGQQKFDHVVANYAGGRSFKDMMEHLNEASRKIADALLHMPMRASEVLPTAQQVNCIQQLDALLAEIVRITPKA